AQVKAEAGPPPKPNTQAPKTVALGPDGRPVEPETSPSWQPMSEGAARGGDVTRPATPLTGTRENPYANGEPLVTTPNATKASSTGDSGAASAPVVPYEDRLDAYLLGRALREWA